MGYTDSLIVNLARSHDRTAKLEELIKLSKYGTAWDVLHDLKHDLTAAERQIERVIEIRGSK